ncbi:MAG: hypothetical protein JWR07_1900 [Nevskia sp.]|nr:hypothetical protein [Nevskia sp.]
MNTTNEMIPMAMAPAKVDGSIPMQADTRLPLSVKPMEPINHEQNQMEMLKVADAQGKVQDDMRSRAEKQVDEYTIKQYLDNGGDLYTADGFEKAAKDLKGKVSIGTYEHLGVAAAQKKKADLSIQEAAGKLKESDFKMVQSQLDGLVNLMADPVSVYDNILKDTGDKGKATEAFQAAKAAQIASAADMKGADGKPLYPPQVLQQFEQASPDAVKARLNTSKSHLDTLGKVAEIKLHESQAAAAAALAKERTDGKQLTSLKAIDAAVESGDISPEDAEKAKAKLTSAPGAAVKPSMTEEAIDLAARRLAAGDKTALQNVGRGKQGAADVAAINNRLPEYVKDPKQILQARATLDAAAAGMKSVGQRGAKIDAAAIEVDKFADNAVASLAKVTRGNLVPLNEIMRKVSLGTGSPEEAEFATYVQSLVGAYASVIGRGSPTVHAQEEAAKVIRKDYSPEQFKAMVAALKVEAKSVVESSKEAGDGISAHTFGKPGAAAPSPATKVSSATQKERDTDSVQILKDELKSTREKASAEVDPKNKERLQNDVAGIKRELKAKGVKVDDEETPKGTPAAPANIDALLKKYARPQ